MNIKETQNPHDQFFKENLAQPGATVDFLRYYLPERIVCLIEPETAERIEAAKEGEKAMETFLDKWMREGRKQGLQQGLQEGLQHETELVLRLLRRQFKRLDGETEARIRELTWAQVESLAEALLDFQKIADLAKWLEQNATNKTN